MTELLKRRLMQASAEYSRERADYLALPFREPCRSDAYPNEFAAALEARAAWNDALRALEAAAESALMSTTDRPGYMIPKELREDIISGKVLAEEIDTPDGRVLQLTRVVATTHLMVVFCS